MTIFIKSPMGDIPNVLTLSIGTWLIHYEDLINNIATTMHHEVTEVKQHNYGFEDAFIVAIELLDLTE